MQFVKYVFFNDGRVSAISLGDLGVKGAAIHFLLFSDVLIMHLSRYLGILTQGFTKLFLTAEIDVPFKTVRL